MDAKTLELSFLATLALVCALAAWAVDNLFFGFVFAAFVAPLAPDLSQAALCYDCATIQALQEMWQARTAPTETDCVAGHVRLEL